MNQIKRVVYELKDLRKDYGNHTVLQIGHLEFHPGTIYGIVGSIGSGKSTLLRLLSGKEKGWMKRGLIQKLEIFWSH